MNGIWIDGKFVLVTTLQDNMNRYKAERDASYKREIALKAERARLKHRIQTLEGYIDLGLEL